MKRQSLLESMRMMRSLVEPEGPAPSVEPMEWTIPHRLRQESIESLTMFAAKLAGQLEKNLQLLSGQPFEVAAESIQERYAERIAASVLLDQPQTYYMPLIQTGKGHAGFISLPFETASVLVGCMLRDPEAEIGRDGQMSLLAESILMDAAAALADAIVSSFNEYGSAKLEKADRLVQTDWPVDFHALEDLCQFEFKAVSGKTTLNLTLTVLDETIADIAQIEGPFGRVEEKKDNAERIVKRMNESPMRVAALLSSALMTLNDILALETGDVIMLDRKITEPIDVLINGQTCFYAWPAVHAGRRAMMVADQTPR